MEYVQNPPKVRAVQWDGTIDGALVIQEFMRENGRRTGFKLVLIYPIDEQGYLVRDRLELDDHIRGPGRDGEECLYSECWLVRWPDGRLEIMGNERFQRDFQVVGDVGADTAD